MLTQTDSTLLQRCLFGNVFNRKERSGAEMGAVLLAAQVQKVA